MGRRFATRLRRLVDDLPPGALLALGSGLWSVLLCGLLGEEAAEGFLRCRGAIFMCGAANEIADAAHRLVATVTSALS